MSQGILKTGRRYTVSDPVANTVDVKLGDIAAFRRSSDGDALPGAGKTSAEPGEAVRRFRVALVTMPFGCAFRPSIQIGLLKAVVRRAGFPVDDHYLNIDLSVRLGFRFCETILNEVASAFTGDWLFSIAAFRDESSRQDYLAACPAESFRIKMLTGKDAAFLNEAREHVIPQYIEDCFSRIDWGAYGAVGFTSIFQQNVASLALARRIKETYPHVAVIFGGSTLDGEMGPEYMRAFPYIDYVVSGEGDVVFPELLRRLAEGRDTDDLLGVVSRHGDCISFLGPAAPVEGLDDLPTPDYDSFFEAVRRYGLEQNPEFTEMRDSILALHSVPIQGSRGCWWGQKSHCTFCGFNRTSMAYRSKSPERVITELHELSTRYNSKAFWACDNIMDMKHVDGLFGPLAARDDGYQFFYFTKSNLTREQLRLMYQGGVRLIFPGIESLSTHVLKLMRKGVTRLQNVNLLKWSTYYGIELGYFLLHGFPGEVPEDYVEELETMRLVTHLAPPMDSFRLRVDRFSPNFYDHDLFPTEWRRPVQVYNYIYPAHVNMEEAAYFFEYRSAHNLVPEEAHQAARDLISAWGDDWATGRRARMVYRRIDGDLVIDDSRSDLDRPTCFTLQELDAAVYEAFSSAPRTPAQVCAALCAECSSLQPDEESIADGCNAFCEAGLMIGEAGKYLSLAIPADPER
jgi:ribosomal peptide maturation radical SAM protein 1